MFDEFKIALQPVNKNNFLTLLRKKVKSAKRLLKIIKCTGK